MRLFITLLLTAALLFPAPVPAAPVFSVGPAVCLPAASGDGSVVLSFCVCLQNAPAVISAAALTVTVSDGWQIRKIRLPPDGTDANLTFLSEGQTAFVLLDGAMPVGQNGPILTVEAVRVRQTDFITVSVSPSALNGEQVPIYYKEGNNTVRTCSVGGCTETFTLRERDMPAVPPEPPVPEADTSVGTEDTSAFPADSSDISEEPKAEPSVEPKVLPSVQPQGGEEQAYRWSLVGCSTAAEEQGSGGSFSVTFRFRAADTGAGQETGTPVIWILPSRNGTQVIRLTVRNEGGDVLFSYAGIPAGRTVRFCIGIAVRTGKVTAVADCKNGKITLHVPEYE